MEILLATCVILSVYSYAIYPVFMHLLAKIAGRRWQSGSYYPRLTIIISAYNEEKDIQEKIDNSLQLDYPEDKLEIIVSSDGSDDGTNEIVAGIDDRRVVLKAFTERLGKTECLNRVIEDASGEIILFTDANSMFAGDTLQLVAKNFADETIGCVTGWTKYHNSDTGEETTSAYGRLEKKTKLDESMLSSCVGADGAIFAIRRELYIPLGANDINDFIIPLNVVRQGKRVVLDPLVFCTEEDTTGLGHIYKRQVRITTRTAWALRRNIGLINIFRYGSFSFFLLSHKILRLLTPFFMIATLALTILLLGKSQLYGAFLVLQILSLLFALAAIGGIIGGRTASMAKYLLITFSAYCVGCLRMAVGIEDIMWTPKR